MTQFVLGVDLTSASSCHWACYLAHLWYLSNLQRHNIHMIACTTQTLTFEKLNESQLSLPWWERTETERKSN